jgi:hypothetical protein
MPYSKAFKISSHLHDDYDYDYDDDNNDDDDDGDGDGDDDGSILLVGTRSGKRIFSQGYFDVFK